MTDRMNLLFICTDQQRTDTLACYGNTQIDTPRLNKLAERSVVFDNAYCTQPWCTPSRSSLLTGVFPHATGCTSNHLPLNRDLPTIAEMLNPDYRCGYFGKWHLGDEIAPQHGFTEWAPFQDHIWRDLYSRPEYLERMSDYHQHLVAHGFVPNAETAGERVFTREQTMRYPEPFTTAAYVARRTAAFVRETTDRPWMAQAHFYEPHPPFRSPFGGLHDPATIEVGPNFRRMPDANLSLVNRQRAADVNGKVLEDMDLSTEAGWRQIRAYYWGLMKLVDNQVGVMLDALEASGQADRTIVIFTSDHGEMLGDHNQYGKHVMFEESVKIPLLVYDPRVQRAPERIGGRFSQVDLVPTMLELLDHPVPSHVHGLGRAAALRDEASLDGDDVFIEWQDTDLNLPGSVESDPAFAAIQAAPRRTIVSHEGWKLTLYEADEHELFDLNNDPHEHTNAMADDSSRPIAEDLHGRIAAWQARVADTVELPDL